MKKIVMPAICRGWTNSGREIEANGFCKIEWDSGKLSISGVIGPRSSGNCAGSAGQCYEEIQAGRPAQGWDREMLDKFIEIWKRWHLNNLNPACEHQRELGWPEQAKEEMTLYRYHLKREAHEKQRAAEKDALSHLRKGEPFTPDAEQVFYAALPSSIDVYDPINEEQAKYYEPWSGSSVYRATEKKTRGWVRFDEDPRGILCKPCPVCGYKYGTAWLREEVPQDVIDWLFALPDTLVRPEWV
ncbi:MAG: hypothetical protein IJI27_08230 [Oscillospiraceae bacterium]|nr:hypothetical protein [Oscillospiraceae bacterium]